MPDFDLNVEPMSREELIENYFNTVHLCEVLLGQENYERVSAFVNSVVPYEKGVPRPQISKTLCALMTGSPKSYAALAYAITENPEELRNLRKSVAGAVSRARLALKGTDVKIVNLREVGYIMPPKSIEALKSLLPKSQFQLTPIAEG